MWPNCSNTKQFTSMIIMQLVEPNPENTNAVRQLMRLMGVGE
jgi:CubicO group peptidase (beta-lactamase class C family)